MVKENIEILEKEVELLTKLNHKHIMKFQEAFISFYGSNQVPGFVIVTELADQTLEDLLTENLGNQFDEKFIFKTFYQVALAVKYLHDNSIIHGKLDPTKIFVKNDLIKISYSQVSLQKDGYTIGETYSITP